MESHIDLFEPLGSKLGVLKPIARLTKDDANGDDNDNDNDNVLQGDGLNISREANEDMNSVISALLDEGVEDDNEIAETTASVANESSTTAAMSNEEFERKMEEIKQQNQAGLLNNVVDEVVKEVNMINEHQAELEEHFASLNIDSPRGLTDEEKNKMRASFDSTSASYIPPIELPSPSYSPTSKGKRGADGF